MMCWRFESVEAIGVRSDLISPMHAWWSVDHIARSVSLGTRVTSSGGPAAVDVGFSCQPKLDRASKWWQRS